MDPFKINQTSSSKAIADKLSPLIFETNDMTCPKPFEDLFHSFQSILCFDCNQFQPVDTLENFIANDGAIRNQHEIVILENYVREDDDVPPHLFNNIGECYELVHISNIAIRNDNSWDGIVSMRHGSIHTQWWELTKKSSVYVERDNHMSIIDNEEYCLIYVKIQTPDLRSASQQILRHIGGQTCVQCLRHKMPLILSTFRKGKCFCSKREHYRCPDFNCGVKCCKKCLEEINLVPNITYVHHNGVTDDPNYRPYQESQNSADDGMDTEDESIPDNLLELQGGEHHEIDEDPETLFYQSDSDSDDSSTSFQSYTHRLSGDEEYIPLQIDNFEDYVTSAEAPDFNVITDSFEEEQNIDSVPNVPATDAGIYPFEVTEAEESTTALQDLIVTGNVLLNQCGTLLTRNNHQIKGSSRGKLLMQRICATTLGKSVPLLQPEASLFPSIFWKMVPNDCVISGAIPTPLLSEKSGHYGFQSLPQHVRTRLTTAFCTTSTDPHYISHDYDMMTNMSATHLDTRIAMNRGLTAGPDTLSGLGVKGGNDSSGAALLGSIDSNEMVRNLCASQRSHPFSFFCTFTCAQARHFGTKNVKLWIDGIQWREHFPGYDNLTDCDKKEIGLGIQQAAACLLLRNWQETCKIFLDYLKESPSSPFRRTGSMFARNEYQKDAGNLSHIHMLIEVKWDEMTVDEKTFVDNLIRTNHLDICPDEEVKDYISQGIFQDIEERNSIQEHGKKVLRHYCNQRCLERTGPGPKDFRCRFSNNLRDNPDPKNDYYLPLPNSLPANVKQKLVELKIIDNIEINDLNYESLF